VALFVSYTRQDEALVRALKDDLERVGRSVWLDHQIHGGERWWQEIIQQIQDAEVFLFALSKDSWRSRPCRAELRYAEDPGQEGTSSRGRCDAVAPCGPLAAEQIGLGSRGTSAHGGHEPVAIGLVGVLRHVVADRAVKRVRRGRRERAAGARGGAILDLRPRIAPVV